MRSAQQALRDKGFDAGAIDGQLGPATQKAVREFQQSQGITPSGNLDVQTLSALGVDQGQSSMQNQSTPPGQSMQDEGATSTHSTQNRDLMKDQGTNNGTSQSSK